MSSPISRIIELIEASDFKASQVLKELDLPNSAMSIWKQGKAKPSTDAIIKFAEFFGVTTDYILLGTDRDGGDYFVTSELEREIITAYRTAKEHNKESILDLLGVKRGKIKDG